MAGQDEKPKDRTSRFLREAAEHVRLVGSELIATKQSGKLVLEVFFVEGDIQEPPSIMSKFRTSR